MAARPVVDVEEAKADTTPMIDVVFLMIVFFVCIDFRMLEAKLPAFLPRDAGAAPARVEPQETLEVCVHVTASGTKVPTRTADGNGRDPATGRPVRHRLVDHRVAWQIGPKRFDDLAAAAAELQRLARDPACFVTDRMTGERRRLAVVIDGGAGTCYDDVARAADACHAAGFAELRFGGGRG